MLVLSISHQAGSLGDEIAKLLSRKLNVRLITHNQVMSDWLPDISTKHDLNMLKESPKHYVNTSKDGISFAEYIAQRLREEAQVQPLIILGLGSQVIFKDSPNAINVRVYAPDSVRSSRIQDMNGLDGIEAEKTIKFEDRRHKKYLKTIYDKDLSDPSLYDICLNTGMLTVEECVQLLFGLFKARTNTPVSIPDTHKAMPVTKAFVHPAEEEFAKILDMYNLEWEYEPKTFPTEWDAEGNIIKAITPDFYLPRFNTYIEITTMDQKYVAEKKRKVRRLKELYPEININIVFKRDFHSLLKRFGFQKGAGK